MRCLDKALIGAAARPRTRGLGDRLRPLHRARIFLPISQEFNDHAVWHLSELPSEAHDD